VACQADATELRSLFKRSEEAETDSTSGWLMPIAGNDASQWRIPDCAGTIQIKMTVALCCSNGTDWH
jgi:hypothetical protein